MKTEMKIEFARPELKRITEILEKFEWQEYCNTGMKMISGGYAKAEMFDYDDEKIDIDLEWGEQDMGGGSSTVHKECYTLLRETVNALDMTVEEKVAHIKG
jgi:hypothetical protein